MQSRQKKCSQFSGVATGWLLNELRQIGHLSESSSELIPTRSAEVPPKAPSTDLWSSSSSSAGKNNEICCVYTIQPTFTITGNFPSHFVLCCNITYTARSKRVMHSLTFFGAITAHIRQGIVSISLFNITTFISLSSVVLFLVTDKISMMGLDWCIVFSSTPQKFSI